MKSATADSHTIISWSCFHPHDPLDLQAVLGEKDLGLQLQRKYCLTSTSLLVLQFSFTYYDTIHPSRSMSSKSVPSCSAHQSPFLHLIFTWSFNLLPLTYPATLWFFCLISTGRDNLQTPDNHCIFEESGALGGNPDVENSHKQHPKLSLRPCHLSHKAAV